MKLTDRLIIAIVKRKMTRAFPVMRPDLPDSARVADEIVGWFAEHAPKE